MMMYDMLSAKVEPCSTSLDNRAVRTEHSTALARADRSGTDNRAGARQCRLWAQARWAH